jgi:hypothetical protein
MADFIVAKRHAAPEGRRYYHCSVEVTQDDLKIDQSPAGVIHHIRLSVWYLQPLLGWLLFLLILREMSRWVKNRHQRVVIISVKAFN